MKDKIDIKDKNGNDVFFGDQFMTGFLPGSKETLVTVIEDNSEENLSCGRNYDVEDEQGNRLWNAYMVIVNREKISKSNKSSEAQTKAVGTSEAEGGEKE